MHVAHTYTQNITSCM